MPINVPVANSIATTAAAAVPVALHGAGAVVSAIRDASARSGTNFDLMLASARMESGLDPSAQASSSSATGLFQFIDQTWLAAVRQYGPQHGLAADAALVVQRDGRLTVDDPGARQRILDLRKNPDIASALAGDHLRGISDKLGLALGRPADAAEVYLGHVLGGAGASQVLQAVRTTPNQVAGDLLPAAARANPALFEAPDGTPYTVTQFMQHLRNRVAHAYAAQGSVMPVGPVIPAGSIMPIASVNRATQSAASGSVTKKLVAAGPRHARQPVEREVIANLTKVFNQIDSVTKRGQSATRHHGNSQTTLPEALLTTMRGSPSGKAA